MSVSGAGKLELNTQEEQHERNSSPTTSPPPEEPNALQFQFQANQEQEDEKNSSLTIKSSSSDREFNKSNKGFEEHGEPTTPTSSDRKIPVTTTCPPAPRKPKSVSIGNKRKTQTFNRISVDLMVKINAMFAPAEVVAFPDFLAGDLGPGNRSKKVKTTDVITGL